MTRSIALCVAAIVVVACGSFGAGPVPPNAAVIRFINATSLPVELRVNGVPRGSYPAWTPEQEVAIFEPGGPPWTVSFIGPEGFAIAELEANGPAGPNEGGSSGTQSTCGRFIAWWGVEPEDKPVVDPAASPPPPPPCE